MSVITGGSVTIEDGEKKSTDYTPARKVSVTLNYDVPEGQDADAVLDRVADVANAKVDELLGRTKRPTATKPVAEAAPPTGKGRKAKEEPKEEPKVAPLADPVTADIGLFEEQAPAAKPADDLGLDEFTVPPAVITDADLNAKVMAKNKEIGNPVVIRTLIASFNPDPSKPFSMGNISPAQRQNFLDRLAELKKA